MSRYGPVAAGITRHPLSWLAVQSGRLRHVPAHNNMRQGSKIEQSSGLLIRWRAAAGRGSDATSAPSGWLAPATPSRSSVRHSLIISRRALTGTVLVHRRIEPTGHAGRVAGTVQVMLISGLPQSPAPAGQVHARPAAGIPQVHHRSARTRPGWQRIGCWPPRAAPSGARCGPAAPGEADATNHPWRRRRVSSRSSGRHPAIRTGATPSSGLCDHARAAPRNHR